VAATLTDAYLARIGIARPGTPDIAALRRIHAAHVAAIPFENLDILLNRPILLDIGHLRAKLLDQRRGGYCFEQNSLLLAVLREFGFAAEPLEARVLAGPSAVRPRTHMLIAVRMDDSEWLADVGFGGEGPIEPVLMTGEPSTQGRATYRVESRGSLRVLQMRTRDEWIDQYSFLPTPVHAVDFEVGNWFTSTYPQSPFVRTLTAQRATQDVRYVLRYPNYSEIRGGTLMTREISRAELLPLLRDVFLIDLPLETTFAVIDANVVEPVP
jgi:N-hydroxyarylamine O-acetyltransferase